MTKIAINTVHFILTIDQDTGVHTISADYNLSTTMPEEQHEYYKDAIAGMISKAQTELDSFAKEGFFIRELNDLRNILDDEEFDNDDSGFSIEFEPDEDEILEEIERTKDFSNHLNEPNKYAEVYLDIESENYDYLGEFEKKFEKELDSIFQNFFFGEEKNTFKFLI